MKILSISSLVPIPGVVKTNDFVFQTYRHYKKLFANDEVVIIKPVKYDLNVIRILKKITILKKLDKKRELQINGFRVLIFTFFSSWSLRNIHAVITQSIFFMNFKKISSLFSDIGFDIIHAQYILPDGLLAYWLHKKYKIPYVLTTHNERHYFKHIISRKTSLKILKAAAGIFTINHYNYTYFKSLNLTNVTMKPLGFNKSFLREQKSPVKNETVKIVTVAELIKLKNIDKVILALHELTGKYNFTYTVIGRGPEKEYLLNLVRSLNMQEYVHFTDYIPHEKIADEISRYDIFIMISYFETFGRVYFEAMAMGIPIICAVNSGIYGLFEDKKEGLAVDHTDQNAIVNALDNLISDPEKRLEIGRNGQKLVKNYTWENIAKDLHVEYNNIIRSKME